MIAQQSRDAQLLQRYASGQESSQQIADSAGISRARLYVILNREAAKVGCRNIAKLRPKRKKVIARRPKPPGLTIRQAAWRLDMSAQCVKQLCWKGRVPFAVKREQWYLPPDSIRFLRRYPHSRGVLGQQVAVKMRKAAARLDPSCKKRQRAYARG